MKTTTVRQKFLKMLLLLCGMIVSMSFCISASAAKESEDNGTFARADKIALGTLVRGAISTPGDDDFFKFTISQKGKITIKEYYYRTSDDDYDEISLRLYDKNRRTIYDQGTDEITTQSISVTPGTYYVRVTQCGMYWSTISYGIRISFSAGNGTYRGTENFNSFQRAKKIGLARKVYGTISKSSECDYYKFTLPADGVIYLTGACAQSNGNDDMWNTYLYDAKKEIIEEGAGLDGKTRVGLPAGTYYIKVTKGNYEWSPEKYYILVQYKKSSVWEKESNETLDCSTAVRLNSYMYGSNNEWNDVDCYTFTMPKDGRVRFEFYIDTESYVTLYNSACRQINGRVLCEMRGGDAWIPISKISKTVSLKKGRYYLKINHDAWMWGGTGNRNYRFRICTVAQPASIKLNRTSVTLSLPSTKTTQLKATVTGTSKKVTWKSSDTRVATVSSTGKVTAKAAGKAVITASANGKTAKCTVTVKNERETYRQKMYAKYKNIVMKNVDEYGRYGMFALYDANRDGIPELYVERSGRYDVYNFVGGQLKKIGRLQEGIFLYSNPDGAGIVNSSMDTIGVYKVTNSKVTRIAYFHCMDKNQARWVNAAKKYMQSDAEGPLSVKWYELVHFMETAQECSRAFERLIRPFM